MGSRYNPKSYSRSSGYSKRKAQLDSVRNYVRTSRSDGTRPRKGQAAVPRALGAQVTSEMKYFDSERAETALSINTGNWVPASMFDPTITIDLGNPPVPTPLCLFCPQQGNGLNGRIGRKVHLYKIRINCTLIMPNQTNQSIADPSAKVRCILVMDKQTNGVQFSPSIFMSQASSAAVSINSFQNPSNFGRFQVLKEKVFIVNSGQLGGSNAVAPDLQQAGSKIHFKMNYVFKTPLLVNFNATNGGTVSDIIDNSIHLICATDNTSLDPRLAYYARCCFKE